MAWNYNAGILFLFIPLFSNGSYAKAEMSGERNKTDAPFLENTRYCDCPPLTEFDLNGNHIWQINIIKPSTDLCGAKYSCRAGYQSVVKSPNDTRFCYFKDVWNHTEMDCRQIDSPEEESTILFIAVPSTLLVILFLVMILFVIWWQRRTKHKSGEGKSVVTERTETEIFQVKGETNANNAQDGRKFENLRTVSKTGTTFQIDAHAGKIETESKLGDTDRTTAAKFYSKNGTVDKQSCKLRCMSETTIFDRNTDIRKTV